MANYFVINNKFRPYSFDELIKPYQMYGEAYSEREEAIGQLEQSAATLASAINQTNDPVAYKTYSNYLQEVRNTADELATKGLSPALRSKVKRLSSEFNQQVLPIQAAYNRRKELQDEQRKALLADNSLMFQRNFGLAGPESSLDRFVEDPNYTYGMALSGNALTDQVAKIAGNLSKELVAYGQGQKLDKFTNTFLQQHGFTSTQVLDAINNPQRATSQPVLNAIVEAAVGSSGVTKWGSPDIISQAYDYARKGLWYSVGQTSVSPFDDYGAKLAAQLENQKSLYRWQREQQGSTVSGVQINPMNLYGSKERKEAAKIIEKYSKYFKTNVDGSVSLTPEGLEKYNAKHYITDIRSGKSVSRNSEFREFIDANFPSLLGKSSGTRDNSALTVDEINKGWKAYMDANKEDTYDTHRITEYEYAYKEDQQDNIKSAIRRASLGMPLSEVDYNANTGKFEPTGKKITMEELSSKDNKVSASRMSVYGTQVIVENEKTGEVTRFIMPSGINITAEGARDQVLRNAEDLRKRSIDETNYTKAEREEYAKAWHQELEKAYLYQSQIGVVNTTEPQKFSVFGM